MNPKREEYLYHYMSTEEYKNFKKNQCIFFKQASSWNDEYNQWEDPFLAKFKIIGTKQNKQEQLKSIKELINTYLEVYNELLNIRPCLEDRNAFKKAKELYINENQSIKFEPNYYYNAFTDVLNFVSVAYTTFVSSWTRNEEKVGMGDKIGFIKIKRENIIALKKEGYQLSLAPITYYKEEKDMELKERIINMIDQQEKKVILKRILLQLPDIYEEEKEERIILTPSKPDFSKSISYSQYAHGKSSNQDEFNQAILDGVNKMKEYFDEQYKKDDYGNIVEVAIPEEYIEDVGEVTK